MTTAEYYVRMRHGGPGGFDRENTREPISPTACPRR